MTVTRHSIAVGLDSKPPLRSSNFPSSAKRDDDDPPSLSASAMVVALATVMVAAGTIAGSSFWLGRSNADASNLPASGLLAIAAPSAEAIAPEARPQRRPHAVGEEVIAVRPPRAAAALSRVEPAPPSEPLAAPAPRAAAAAPVILPARAGPPHLRQPSADPAPRSDSSRAAPQVLPQGGLIQLGAFSSKGRAEQAWQQVSVRFPQVAGLTKTIVPYAGGVRLRAAAATATQAAGLCAELAHAGQGCFVVR